MYSDSEWELIRNDRWSRVESAGMGALRVTLLFGSAAVAFALIATPIAENRARDITARNSVPMGIDRMVTGSSGYAGEYTVRRSVLQSAPNAVCIIRDNGTRSGDC